MKLNHDSPIPLYHQIERSILGLIRQQKLTTGSQLPSEVELASHFGVTRLTIRRALERLAQQGVLYRQRGRGTFVADPSAGQHVVHTLTLILPDSSNPLYLAVLAGVEQEARAHGFQVAIALSDNDVVLESQHIQSAVSSGSVGLVLWPLGDETQKDELARFQPQHFPVVLVDRYFTELDIVDRVVVDDFGGAYQATAHLAELGHRRIAFVYGPEGLPISTVQTRREGYKQALLDHGLTFLEEWVLFHSQKIDPTDLRFTESLVGRLLQLSPPPTAAFCVHDNLAQAFLIALQGSGIPVPQRFSVVGFDGLEYLPVHQRLTTVRRATDEMGIEAVRLVVARLNEGVATSPPRHVVLPTELVLGETTAAAPPM